MERENRSQKEIGVAADIEARWSRLKGERKAYSEREAELRAYMDTKEPSIDMAWFLLCAMALAVAIASAWALLETFTKP
jgi:hypothetical protein